MNWHLGPMIGFDTETSGVNVETDRIVTACIALLDGSGRPDAPKPETIQAVIDPGIDIPTAASDVHGWTTERLAAEPTAMTPTEGIEFVASMLATALLDQPEAPLVAFNAPFDLTILDRECRRYELPTLGERLGVIPHDPIIRARKDGRPLYVVDPMVLDKHVDRYRRGSRKLTAVCEHYGVPFDGAHDAGQDALAAARAAWMIAHRHPPIARMSLAALHSLQVKAKREQAESFRSYLRKQNKSYADVSGEWPMVPAQAQGALV